MRRLRYPVRLRPDDSQREWMVQWGDKANKRKRSVDQTSVSLSILSFCVCFVFFFLSSFVSLLLSSLFSLIVNSLLLKSLAKRQTANQFPEPVCNGDTLHCPDGTQRLALADCSFNSCQLRHFALFFFSSSFSASSSLNEKENEREREKKKRRLKKRESVSRLLSLSLFLSSRFIPFILFLPHSHTIRANSGGANYGCSRTWLEWRAIAAAATSAGFEISLGQRVCGITFREW